MSDYENLSQKVIEIDSRSKDNTLRINECQENIKKLTEKQDKISKLTTSVEVLATRQGNVETTVTEIKTDVRSLMDKPAKRWDSVVDKILYIVISAALGYMLSQIGL